LTHFKVYYYGAPGRLGRGRGRARARRGFRGRRGRRGRRFGRLVVRRRRRNRG